MFGIKKRLKKIEEKPTGLWFSWWAFILGLLGAWLVTVIYGFRLDWRSWFKISWVLSAFVFALFCRNAQNKIVNRNPSDKIFPSLLISYVFVLYFWFGIGSFLWLYVLVYFWK